MTLQVAGKLPPVVRVALGRLLLQSPDLLLLDEPTNHLDLESLQWLEDFLGAYEGTVVIISHDRYFLHRVVDRIAELELGRFTLYVGDYDDYQSQKLLRQEQLEAAQKSQSERIEKMERFIRKFRYKATKARQVQNRIKPLDKIERVEMVRAPKRIHFRFPQPARSGAVVSELKKVQKKLGCARASLGSLSEATSVFDADRIRAIIAELGDQLEPLAQDKRLSDIRETITLVDGSLIAALPKKGQWTAVLSNHLLFEYEEILKQDAAILGLSLEAVDEILNAVCARGQEWPLTHGWHPILTDPDDEPLVQLAVESGARRVVTHNIRDLQPATRLSVATVEPTRLSGETTGVMMKTLQAQVPELLLREVQNWP